MLGNACQGYSVALCKGTKINVNKFKPRFCNCYKHFITVSEKKQLHDSNYVLKLISTMQIKSSIAKKQELAFME